jgi:hypothetical protein
MEGLLYISGLSVTRRLSPERMACVQLCMGWSGVIYTQWGHNADLAVGQSFESEF